MSDIVDQISDTFECFAVNFAKFFADFDVDYAETTFACLDLQVDRNLVIRKFCPSRSVLPSDLISISSRSLHLYCLETVVSFSLFSCAISVKRASVAPSEW